MAFSPAIRAGRKVFSVLPLWVVTLVLFPFLRMANRLGVLARYLHVGRRVKSIGKAVYLAPMVVFKNADAISIGDNCSVHEFCYLDGAGGIEINNNVSIAHNCSILSSDHGWADATIAIKYNPVRKATVRIHDDVWLGCGVRILAGVEVGERTIVAAGAVVTRSLEGGCLYAGIPARKVRSL